MTKAGSTSARPVNLLDIYPTLAFLTGCAPPENQLEGNDLTALMRDPNAEWQKTSLTVFGYKNYGLRSDRYRYITYADGTEELYDHEKDRWEWQNLADSPEYTDVKTKMRKGLPTHHEPDGVTYDPRGQKRNASIKIVK